MTITDNDHWCCNHISIEDGNLEDEQIKWCLKEARENDHERCAEVAQWLLSLNERQRETLYQRNWR